MGVQVRRHQIQILVPLASVFLISLQIALPQHIPITLTTGLAIMSYTLILLSPRTFGILGFISSFLVSQEFIIWLCIVHSSCKIIFLETSLLVVTLLSYLAYKKSKQQILNFEINLTQLNEKYNRTYENLNHIIWKKHILEQKISRFVNLRHIIDEFSSTLSLEEIYNITSYHFLQLLNKGDTCFLFTLDANLNTLCITQKCKITDKSYQIHPNAMDRFNRWCLRNHAPLLVEDVHEDYRFEPDDDSPNLRSLINIPLITDNKFLGILRLASTYPRIFQMDDLRLGSILGQIASVSIKNAKLYSDTLLLSSRDGLTQLYVSKHFHENVDKQILQSQDHSRLSLIMADIDNFKKINDAFGHTVGDSILRLAAQIFLDTITYDHLATRYGGEEFSAFFINQDLSTITELCQKIRQSIDETALEFRRTPYQITISIGIASYLKSDSITKDFLIQTADQALYQAKHSGKNKIVVLHD